VHNLSDNIIVGEREDVNYGQEASDIIISQSPLSVTLRSIGQDFGKCFCKFGSRAGKQRSQGYDNIVPEEYNDFCPL
jgi:hypothetical protein